MQFQAINFHGDQVFLVEKDGEPYVPTRPICENLGIDWSGQHSKLSGDIGRWNCRIISMIASDGKNREMLCIPLRKLPAWLFSISTRKVKPELKDKLIKYQEECDDVLWDYWLKGRAINPRQSLELEDEAEPYLPWAIRQERTLEFYRQKREEMRFEQAKQEIKEEVKRQVINKLMKFAVALEQENIPVAMALKVVRTKKIGLTIEEIARALEISPEKAEQIEKIARRNGFWKYINEEDRENGKSRS